MAIEPGVFLPLSRKISKTITVNIDKKIQFRDTGIYLQSSADGKLKISSDGTGTDDLILDCTVNVDEGLYFTKSLVTASSVLSNNVSYVDVNASTVSGSAIAVATGAPAAGRFLVIANTTGKGTANVSCGASCTFDGTSGTAYFASNGQVLVLFGISATRFVIVENIGTVVLTT